MIPLGGIKVNRDNPKISVKIINNIDSLEVATLILRRVGGNTDLPTYAASKIGSDYVEFTFDEVLFAEFPGRYAASFYVDDIKRSVFYIQLEDNESIIVANA